MQLGTLILNKSRVSPEYTDPVHIHYAFLLEMPASHFPRPSTFVKVSSRVTLLIMDMAGIAWEISERSTLLYELVGYKDGTMSFVHVHSKPKHH
jgi:hypothetical protein